MSTQQKRKQDQSAEHANAAGTEVRDRPASGGAGPSADARLDEQFLHDGKWKALPRDADGEDHNEEDDDSSREENAAELRRLIREAFHAEHVIVLAGLGASCVAAKAPKMGNLWERLENSWTEERDGQCFGAICRMVNYPKEAEKDFELLLSRCEMYQEVSSGENSEALRAFAAHAQKVVARACSDFYGDEDLAHHKRLLRCLAGRSPRRPRAQVFTTNYDLMFEDAAAKVGCVLVDGFSYQSERNFNGAFFDYDFVRRDQHKREPEYLSNVVHLMKLHGSLDWTRRHAETVKERKTEEPLIVYPRSDKYRLSYRQPFLEMMSRWQIALRQRNISLLIVGCGFNDEHVVGPLQHALEENPELRVFVVDVACRGKSDTGASQTSIGDDTPNMFRRLASASRENDRRITLIQGGMATLARFLPLPDVTEDVAHERIWKGSHDKAPA